MGFLSGLFGGAGAAGASSAGAGTAGAGAASAGAAGAAGAGSAAAGAGAAGTGSALSAQGLAASAGTSGALSSLPMHGSSGLTSLMQTQQTAYPGIADAASIGNTNINAGANAGANAASAAPNSSSFAQSLYDAAKVAKEKIVDGIKKQDDSYLRNLQSKQIQTSQEQRNRQLGKLNAIQTARLR